MLRSIVLISAVTLAGCVSGGEWQSLRIDGSSDTAFSETFAVMDEALSHRRSGMLEVALVDIAQTGVQDTAGDNIPYTWEDLRAAVDGLTYDEIVALADESGVSTYQLYWSPRWRSARRETTRQMTANDRPMGPVAGRMPSIDSSGRISWPQ